MSEQFSDEVIEGLPATVAADPKLQLPRKYKVFLLNDDYTPMEFVVGVLISFFNLSEDVATRVMLQIHTRGKGLCGVYTRDIAETKVALVNEYAKNNDHPLLCSMVAE